MSFEYCVMIAFFAIVLIYPLVCAFSCVAATSDRPSADVNGLTARHLNDYTSF